MYNTYVNTVIQKMGSNRRQWSGRPGRVGPRSALVALPGSAGVAAAAGAAAVTVRTSAATTARRRWFLRRDRSDIVTLAPADIKFTWGNRDPGTAGFALWAAAAGQRIAEHGLDGASRDVDNVIAVAQRSGVSPVAVGVLADADAPEPARLRAFAVVVSALVGLGSASPTSPTDAA